MKVEVFRCLSTVQGPLREGFDKPGNSEDGVQPWGGGSWRFPLIQHCDLPARLPHPGELLQHQL